VTETVSWVILYTAGNSDSSAIQQGTVIQTSIILKLPYLLSGQGGLGFFCVKGVNVTGSSLDAGCNAVPIPAAPSPPPPPPPTGTLTTAQSVSRCIYVLVGTPPDATGGWSARFYRGGTTAIGNAVTAAPYQRSVELVKGS
jgi:hypothetical protein